MLAGIGWIIWPFIVGPGQMKHFCAALPVGASVGQVRAEATKRGYRVSSPIEGSAFVHDPKTFGRFTCNVQFGPNGLVSALYHYND